MNSKNYGSGGCGCGGGSSRSKGINAMGAATARTGHHARARSVGQAAPGGAGCGCGGSCNGDCDGGCGSASGSCGCNPGVLVQPSFFAGQLLTDDDLQALTNYVVTRQRMHNRFLVGSGVACGLAVTCHPCGGGRVIVQPGYAVDCCGNEILVPCAVELDINAMVRALKISMQGQDCGDPCAEPVKDRSKQSRAAPGAAAAQPGKANVPAHDKDPERGRRYCLYLDYCEEPTDLVAPYTQDDSCAVTCQPSRLREGFSFELRCPIDEPEPPSFTDRLNCCIGDLREADRKASEIERSQAYAQRNRLGVVAYRLEKPPGFDAEDAAQIGNAGPVLSKSVEDLTKAGSADSPLREQKLRTALDELHAVGAAIARFNLLPPEEREKVLGAHQGLDKSMANVRDALEKMGPALDQQSGELLASPFERTLARSIVAEARKYANPDLPEAERKTQQAYVYAYNGVATPAANTQVHESLASFKSWLLRKMDECPPTGQCCLEAEINAIVVPTGEETTEATYRAYEKLARAFIRYLLDCVCAALLPPCPTCDDPAVKLACLQIDDCNVCEICNLERTFLLTENNQRYWIPLLHTFGEALERLCCDFAHRFQVRTRPPADDPDALPAQHVELRKQAAFFKSGKQLGDMAASNALFPSLLRVTGLDLDEVRSSLNIGGNFALLTARDPQVASMIARHSDADIASLAIGNAFTPKRQADMPNEMVRAEAVRAAEKVQKHVDTQLKDVTKEIDKRLSPDALGQATVIRELKKMLDEQVLSNEALSKRLATLERKKTP
ncbi:hypothetical protein H4CHR_00502 [Variovorax sp. PBS-H4]|uniref:hypothetical protein n=1 Tax=Variovorax sp. PBS-H4 TaxID=434008 RepID=UPI001315FE37|nr:hypothetical protein [Variovorax sp. PBS-H4]VTU20024.1 hypothetical protein H4CHR_00502 [Variovorax sp. PBS-H4]